MSFPKIASWNVRGFNSPEKVNFCKSLVSSMNLKMLCILEAKISSASINDQWFLRSHRLFENEGSCNNFGDAVLGRIWIKWEVSVLSFNPISSSSQHIHGILSMGSFPPIHLTVIYAANSVEERKHLWEQIIAASPPVDQPWIIMGDFNCYRFDYEKAGGSVSSPSRLGELNSFIFNCGVQDLSSTGLYYTWFNQRVDNLIHIKLDRILVNNAFLDVFPHAYYCAESHLGSDHSPLIFNSSHEKPLSVRFKFKNYWINLDGFWDDVIDAFSSRSARSPIASFYHSLQTLKRSLKNRNWASSSHLSNVILEIKSKQHQCLVQLQSLPLDKTLNQNLKNINEELATMQNYWTSWIAQRAKVLCLTKGEDDLGFLYAHIRSRNNRNNIKEIYTLDGHFTKFNDISTAIIKHIEGLFNTSIPHSQQLCQIPQGKLITPLMSCKLISPLTFDEARKAVFDGNENTAPGPDGFTYGFYRKTWHLIGLQVYNAVANFFSTGSMPKGVKATAIALIPKTSHASNISDFRSISLCNVLYKIVAKVIANRMKEILPFIIHESQSGFIANRCSTNNIILAAELLRDFKGNKKLFCAKLDVKKAFDTISREYILDRLLLKGFPEKFVTWIKGCISDVHFSICLNGSLEGFFNSSSGLRQGCPLSPLLFCIAMDGLSNILTDQSSSHNFKGIQYKNFSINHLLYADDLLVMGESSIDNARNLNTCLNNFASISGLHINPSKSAIMFSNSEPTNQIICEELGIHSINPFLIYLGLPISPKRLKASHFQPLLSKLFALLDGWKNKFLSFAGRIQFLKFTITNSIAYWIRGSIIPKGCCAMINKLCSKFLFHNHLEGKKLHLIPWSKVIIPKEAGGLGILSIDALYFGVFCSIIGRFYNNPNLLTGWYKAKYISPMKHPPPSASRTWHRIYDTFLKVRQHLTFPVALHSTLSFFWDPWLNGNSIGEFSSVTGTEEIMLKDVFWNDLWHIPNHIHPNFHDLIKSVAIKESNIVLWDGNIKWEFKGYTEMHYSNLPKVDWYKSIWHKSHALKFSCFTWMARIGKLKTADNLRLRGIMVPINCSLCSGHIENHSHLFFECDFSFYVLKIILPKLNCFLLRPNLAQAMEFIENTMLANRAGKDFTLLVLSCIVYHVWKERNQRRFSNNCTNVTKIICNILEAVRHKSVKWKNKSSLFQEFLGIQ
ncbi:Putative ribonuclease H protein [Dendrobium catenatum]|uniref:Ribonuclease H protein n=1 Tax=Dendrobium catenatum TaxID=906689 RepID=A0A2I0WV66_9ASPA|nr:Putative ribonuclease H protein [Dendrobium catenatum]